MDVNAPGILERLGTQGLIARRGPMTALLAPGLVRTSHGVMAASGLDR
jgi:hypothetical protein